MFTVLSGYFIYSLYFVVCHHPSSVFIMHMPLGSYKNELFELTVFGLSVCLSVRLFVHASSRTTGYEAANEWHQPVVNRCVMWRFSWNDCVPEIWRENSQRAVDRARALSIILYSAHMSIFRWSIRYATWLYDPRASVSFDLCSQWINMLSKVAMSAM